MIDCARLKLLFVCEATDGGVAQQLIDLLKYYDAENIYVTIVYSPKRLSKQFVSTLASLNHITAIELPISETPSTNWLSSIIKLRAIIKQLGPFDILHSQSSIAGGILRLASLNLPGSNIYTPHCLKTADPNQSALKGWLYGAIERRLAHINTAKIICVSEWERQHALLFGLPVEKLVVVNNGIDLQSTSYKTKSRNALSIPDGEIAIGFVGRLVPQKSPLSLIPLASKLKNIGGPIRLHIIGDGPLLSELQAGVADKELSSLFNFHGSLAGPKLVGAFDLVVMPSLYEAFSYVLLEALGAGVPVVSTDCGAAQELLTETGAGVVTPVGDEDGFSREIVKLILNRERLAKMSIRARDVAKKYTVERMAKETIQVYQSVLG